MDVPHAEGLETPKGAYWRYRVLSDGRKTAWFSDGRHLRTLDDHEIAADGLVNPSVECPSCDFHVSGVRLVGWQP